MAAADINDLPDSDFAYIEPGGKVVAGKTEPRSLRHFPIHDAAHVRNALARMHQSPFGEKARPKIEAAAKRMGIGEPAGKALGELKAEPMGATELDLWLAGKRARRILMLPYGGPIPSKASPLGVDIDGEWFDDATDLYDGHSALQATRARLTDWHHDRPPEGDPMKGAILGTTFFDDQAETVTLDGIDYTGRWADFWANAGEQRRALVAALERRGVPLYASSQAAYKKASAEGHIDVWPVIRNTISTSPQNTYAVVPPLKALLTAPNLDELPGDAIKALLVGLDDAQRELLLGPDAASAVAPSQAVVKAGRVLSAQTEAELNRVIELAEQELPSLIRRLIARAHGESA